MFHLILHPTDLSDTSLYAFRVATELAREQKARVVILHVVETLGPENVTYGEVAAALQPQEYRQRLLEALAQRFATPVPGVEVEPLLVEGDPADEIVRIASERRCDLIVMGTHARTGLRRLFTGSVAEAVARQAPARC